MGLSAASKRLLKRAQGAVSARVDKMLHPIRITETKVTSTTPMEYGQPVGSPAHAEVKKRLKILQNVRAESGKGQAEIDEIMRSK